MLYLLGVLGCVIGTAWFLRGSVSLQKRDEHAIKHYQDEANFHQIQSHWSNGP